MHNDRSIDGRCGISMSNAAFLRLHLYLKRVVRLLLHFASSSDTVHIVPRSDTFLLGFPDTTSFRRQIAVAYGLEHKAE
jgi:hypothetical protein